MSKLYEERVMLAKKVMACEKTFRMPWFPSFQTWGISYGGGTSKEVIGHPDIELKYYGKAVRDTHADGVLIFGLNRPEPLLGPSLGYERAKIAEDGVTIILEDDISILDDEVKSFADDPVKFARDVAVPRRYPNINKPYPENVNAALGAIKGLMKFGKRGSYIDKHLRKEYETPMLSSSPLVMPFDTYITMRSFAKGMTDLRRNSSELLIIMDKLYEINKPNQKLKEFPYAISPMTSGTYLNEKMFDKFYWPTCKKTVDDVIRLGGKVILFLEGNWRKDVIEHFKDFPKGTVTLMLDENDPVEVKKYMGNHVGIIGGFPVMMLKESTPAECKKQALKQIEKMGNEGMALTIDKCLLSPNDAKAENVIAVGEVCRDYRF